MKKTLLRFAAVTTGALLSTAGVLPAFATAPTGAPTAVPAGWGAGYNGVINGHAAAAWLMKVEGGDTVEVFCADEPATFDSNPATKYTATTWAGSGRPNLGKAADIAEHAASLGTPLSDKNSEYAARQLAIWKFTNNLDYTSVNNAAIRNRATELVGKATVGTEGPSSAVLTVTTTPAEVKSLVKVHLATVAGAPLVGQTVTVSANGIDLTAKTDTSGDAETTVTTPTKDTTVLATYTGVLPAGTVLVPASAGSQKVITTTAAKITRTASATLTGAAVPMAPPTPTPSATASPKPSATPSTVPSKAPTTPSAAPKQLPYTGTWVTLPLVLGVAAVAALGWYLRRRSTA